MLEIEMKFPLADFAAIEGQLAHWNIPVSETRREADHYFNAPDRDFAQTDEALRVRCVGDRNCVTYKGPKQAGAAKVRKEIEIRFADGEPSAQQFRELLTALGYRPVTQVEKTRRVFRFTRDGFELHITLDDVTDLGCFTEIEIVADEANRAKAEAVVASLARELNLSDSEPRSYLEMILERQQ